MRELKLDSAFLARAKAKDDETRVSHQRAKQQEIQTWLSQEQATFNQQVRKGGELIKGGGSFKNKKARTSREVK